MNLHTAPLSHAVPFSWRMDRPAPGRRDRQTICFDLDPSTGTPAAPTTPATQQQAAPPATLPGMTAEQAQAFLTPILGAIRQQVSDQLAPIQQANTALQQRLDQLSQPRTQGASVFAGNGRAPAVQTGESALTSRGYNYWRALGFRQGFLPADQAKVEMTYHERLYQHFVEQGGLTLEGNSSILVPMGSAYLAGMAANFCEEIRQCLQAGLHGANHQDIRRIAQTAYNNAEGNPYHRQALSQFDDTGLGVLLGPTQQGEMIELLRNREVFSRAGATNIALPPNGRLQFPKQTGATTAYWVGEVPSNASTPTITASEPTSGYLTLIAKKLAALVKLPNELLRFASPSVEAFLRMDLARTFALKADSSMLDGVGSTIAVKGLINYAGINTHIASTVGTHGNTFEPEDPSLMLSELEQDNHDTEGVTWISRSEMYYQMLNRRWDSVTAADGKGGWMFPMNRDQIANGLPGAMLGKPWIRSNQVSAARSKGSGTDLSYVLAGLFEHWMIGRVGVMEFATSTQGDTAFTTDQSWIRAIQHMDAGPRYEDAFVFCDTLLRTI